MHLLLTATVVHRVCYIAILLAALTFFIWTIVRRLRVLQIGPSDPRWDHPIRRMGTVFLHVFGQIKMVRRPIIGIAHIVIFWGFCILSLGTINFLLEGWSPSVQLPFTTTFVFGWLQDMFTVLVIIAVGVSFVRRIAIRPPYVRLSWDAHIILGLILGLMLTDLSVDSSHTILMTQALPGMWASPWLSSWFAMASWHPETVQWFHLTQWWLHLAIFLSFLCYLPFSKHSHVLTSLPNIFFATLKPWGQMTTLDLENSQTFGADTLADFTWKQKLDALACTECGRCSAVCPATTVGKKLDPANIIIHLRDHLEHKDLSLSVHGNTVTAEELWACTTCAACMHACPLLIEHVPAITDMRRHLVLMKGELPAEPALALRNMEQNANPWGISPEQREVWLSQHGLTPLAENGTTDVLLWVGCAGALDSRSKRVISHMITILRHAGISFGVLGKKEVCTGDPARRIGNEYLFQTLAQTNIATLNSHTYRTILTTCPHCMNTLKNEYPGLGLRHAKVMHHAEFLAQLVAQGKIRLRTHGSSHETVTLHDSCYLTRYNDIVGAPRAVIAASASTQLVEMPRHGKNNFCCGAGGGRMWMEEPKSQRVNINRAQEAMDTGAHTVITECPFCMTMMTDGTKSVAESHPQQPSVVVKDLAEWVSERLDA